MGTKWVRKDPDELRKYSIFQQWKDSWKYSKKFKYSFMFVVVLAVVAGFLSVLPSFIYGRIINDLTNLQFDFIYILLIIWAVGEILYSLIDRVNDNIVYKKGLKIVNQTNIHFYNKLFRMDFGFFEKHPAGNLMNQITTGSKAISDFNKTFYRKFLMNCFMFIFSLVSLLYFDKTVALIGIATAIIFLFWMKLTDYTKIKLEYLASISRDKEQGKIMDYLSHIQLVKLLNIRGNLLRALQRANTIIQKTAYKARDYMNKKVFVEKNLIRLSFVFVVFFLARSFIKGNIAIGVLVTAYSLYGRFIRGYMNARGEYNNILNARPAMFKLHNLNKVKSSIEEPTNPKRVGLWKNIKFENVSFSYPGTRSLVLKDVSFEIKRGEKLAIVGLSGSGKSTISKLLFKIYLVNGGKISIGKTEVNDIHSEDLYEFMKMVPQENELINTTIYENLKFGTSNHVNKKDLFEALRKSESEGFVKKMPKGIMTLVGPNGVRISGGEKQRLAIARALLSKPQVLVLDEATSHLDVLTEKKIHDSIHNLGKNQTVVAITHRISSMYLFDRIIVIDKGKIMGVGTHNQLLRSNPQYQKLWRQSKKVR